jgi:2-oxo-4-hydroxy-4-carboxy-5-ureidoimidazoline decarboxylase
MIQIEAVNRMDRQAFVRTFGKVFEHSHWVAERAWSSRPFAGLASLHGAMVDVVRSATSEERLELLRAHPELAGKEARAKAMTEDSVSEQGSAGLDRMSQDDFAHFDRLNAAYAIKFGFPFIIAVRGRSKATIVSEFERRLQNDPAAELNAALDEIFAITRMRLDILVSE